MTGSHERQRHHQEARSPPHLLRRWVALCDAALGGHPQATQRALGYLCNIAHTVSVRLALEVVS